MKSGVSLQQMLTEVKRQSESKEDYLIAPNRLRMESYGKEMFLHLSDDSGTELIEPMTITGIAHRQIGTHLRIPAAYYDRMREERPDLLAYNANTWFKQENSQRMKIQDTVRAAVEEARFSQIVGKMQEAKAAQMDTHDVPAVVKLASKEFHITDSESTGVLQRLIESNDLTLYGLSNAVTRHSQDVESYDRASELESIGYSILTMPAQQWSRINRAAA